MLTRVHGHGEENGGAFGVPVAGGHDCDGDGHKDVAFAQITGDPLGRTNAGEVTLFFGDGTIGGTFDGSVFGPRFLRIAGDQVQETAGAEIWMDDVTGDGVGDVLIGRQNHTPEIGREGAGALTIIVGDTQLRSHAATSNYLDLRSPPPGIKILSLVGDAAYDRLGIWMRTGDIDGDGTADIVVGADEVDEAGQTNTYNSGAVYVIRGGAHLTNAPAIVDLALFGATQLEGHIARVLPPLGSTNFHFGATTALGDLDGNGRAEVLAAATLNRAGATLRLDGHPPGTSEGGGGSSEGSLFIAWDENFPLSIWPTGYTFRIDAPVWGDFTRIDGKTNSNGTENRNFGEEILAGLDYKRGWVS